MNSNGVTLELPVLHPTLLYRPTVVPGEALNLEIGEVLAIEHGGEIEQWYEAREITRAASQQQLTTAEGNAGAQPPEHDLVHEITVYCDPDIS